MEYKPHLKQYRIGDFARHLGVTSDFLKHYEQAGLLQAHQRESGYRYFAFDQSARVIEYMRLRNYGVSVKDMNDMLAKDAEKTFEMLDEKAEELRRTGQRLIGIAREHECLRAWYEKRRSHPIEWEIREMEPYCFLPHTDYQDFSKDERVFELLRTWGQWIPVTKSALLVENAFLPTHQSLHWGLAVPEKLLHEFDLPVNASIRRLSFEKTFVFHFSGLANAFRMDDIVSGSHPAYRKIRELGFHPIGTGLLINEMRLADCDGENNSGVGRFVIPVER